MLSNRRARVRARRGAILVLVAVLLVALLGVAALSVDGGNLYQERRRTQVAADAAADAAAVELYSKYGTYGGRDTDGQAKAAALALATAHGYSGSTVTVNIPPTSGAFAGKYGYAEVIITSVQPRGFSAVLGQGALNVVTRSVAAGTMISTKAGVLVLDPTRGDSLKLKGKNSSLEVGGDIVVNSKHKSAVKVEKKAQIKADHLIVAGKIDRKKSKGLIDAEVSTGVTSTPDPWASLPAPTKGTALDPNKFKTGSGDYEVYNLPPGTYKGLKFDHYDSVTLNPGVYYIDGDGFQVKDNATLQANGVMIYNSGKKGFKVDTKGDVTISPPTSGAYKGISLFQNRATKTKVEFKKSQIDVTGVIYAPNSEVKFRKSDATVSGDTDDDDWDAEGDDSTMADDGGIVDYGSIGASIVASKLSLDEKSHVNIQGADISALRPLLGIVE